jgi:hypothetical protein
MAIQRSGLNIDERSRARPGKRAQSLAASAHGGPLTKRTCSSKLQQQKPNLAVVDATIRGWLGTNDAQRGLLRHFASRGSHSVEGNSNNDLPHAQFVPNMARNCGHSRVFRVSVFLCI